MTAKRLIIIKKDATRQQKSAHCYVKNWGHFGLLERTKQKWYHLKNHISMIIHVVMVFHTVLLTAPSLVLFWFNPKNSPSWVNKHSYCVVLTHPTRFAE